MMESRTFLPAAGHDWFLPLYDPVVKLLGGETAKRELVAQAALLPGHRILDIGCGTGSLAVLLKRLHPDTRIVGLDPDPRALERGRRKAARDALDIQFDQGFSDELPYPPSSFDRVFSSFMFHHLGADEKERTLGEVRRVIKPGGLFHMVDFEVPDSGGGLLARWLYSSPHLKDNAAGAILAGMSRAGFADPKRIGQRDLLVLRSAYYQASVPGSNGTAGDGAAATRESSNRGEIT